MARMRIEVLSVPECPHVGLLEERLGQVLGGRTPLEVRRWVIADPAEAAARGMAGSPTLLLDGVDPFAGPGDEPSVACRLYRQEDGALAGAPSVAQLRRALGDA